MVEKIRAGRKPSSVPRIFSRAVIIYLGPRLLESTSDLPGSLRRAVLTLDYSRVASLCGLAPGGVFQVPGIAAGTGELLPHRFTLAPFGAVFFSVALSMGSPPVPFRDRLALRSSDFPPPGTPGSDHLTRSDYRSFKILNSQPETL